MPEFPQQNGRFDVSRIDLHGLPPVQWVELKKQIALRARHDRNRAIRAAIRGAFGWLLRIGSRLLRPRQLRAAWISHVRRRRERIAAAELRGFSDPSLADMGLTRGQIENCVRFRARSSPRRR